MLQKNVSDKIDLTMKMIFYGKHNFVLNCERDLKFYLVFKLQVSFLI